jgi:hypothetical protein
MTNASARRRVILRATYEVFALILQTNFEASKLSGERVLRKLLTRIGTVFRDSGRSQWSEAVLGVTVKGCSQRLWCVSVAPLRPAVPAHLEIGLRLQSGFRPKLLAPHSEISKCV